MPISLRDATPADLDAIFAIYDREVLEGTATFETRVCTAEQRTQYLAAHRRPAHPLLVAEEEGRVVGYGALSAWSNRCAYARAAEVSVYVAPGQQGKGVGRTLVERLISEARSAGLGVLLSRISSESLASLKLHQKLGFRHVGTLRRVGEKFGRLLDVEIYELQL